MDIVFLILAVIGISFAFETPRKYVVGLFKKTPEIAHSFKIRTSFHTHNNGQKLGALGSNVTEKKYFLDWVLTNNTDQPIQIEAGILLKGASLEGKDMLLSPPEFNTEQTILPRHSIKILSVELTPSQIDHYRHWARESITFGIKTTGGTEYLVHEETFALFQEQLQSIAIEYGLEENLPEGQTVVVSVQGAKKE